MYQSTGLAISKTCTERNSIKNHFLTSLCERKSSMGCFIVCLAYTRLWNATNVILPIIMLLTLTPKLKREWVPFYTNPRARTGLETWSLWPQGIEECAWHGIPGTPAPIGQILDDFDCNLISISCYGGFPGEDKNTWWNISCHANFWIVSLIEDILKASEGRCQISHYHVMNTSLFGRIPSQNYPDKATFCIEQGVSPPWILLVALIGVAKVGQTSVRMN